MPIAHSESAKTAERLIFKGIRDIVVFGLNDVAAGFHASGQQYIVSDPKGDPFQLGKLIFFFQADRLPYHGESVCTGGIQSFTAVSCIQT